MLLVWCHWRKLNSGQIPPQESQNHRISPMRSWSAQLKRKVCTSLSPFNHQMKQTPILQMGRLRPRKGCRMLRVTEQPGICGRIKPHPFRLQSPSHLPGDSPTATPHFTPSPHNHQLLGLSSPPPSRTTSSLVFHAHQHVTQGLILILHAGRDLKLEGP